MIRFRLQRPLGAALCGIAVTVGLTAILGAAAPLVHTERDLYTADELARIYRRSPLGPLPPGRVAGVAAGGAPPALGNFLFFDPRLSANGDIACATCHQPARGFSDGRAVAKGLLPGTRNTPSLLNAALNHWFFWDGRADSLWSQALQPLEGPREAGGDRLHIAHLAASDPALGAAHQRGC